MSKCIWRSQASDAILTQLVGSWQCGMGGGGLLEVILLGDPKCLGLALLLNMPFIHFLKLTPVHGPASLLGQGDITSAWPPTLFLLSLNAGFLSSRSW